MKTGVIYCPKHVGLKSVAKRWQKIAEALQRHGVEYDLVQSENAGSVERIVRMMIHNGYDTIIIAGGDSALNDTVNCLMREERSVRERITVGVIPNGMMNDFAKFWGFTEKDIDAAVESIKVRRTRRVDVGCLQYTDKDGEHLTRYFLNCVNIGLIATIQKLRRQTRRIVWSRKISFVVSFLLLLFQRMSYKMRYTINYETEQHNITTVCIGNALGYGQTPNAVPYNGMLDVSALRTFAFTQAFTAIALFLSGRFLNHKDLMPYRCHEAMFILQKGTPVSVDNCLLSMSSRSTELQFSVAEEAVNFIIEAP